MILSIPAMQPSGSSSRTNKARPSPAKKSAQSVSHPDETAPDAAIGAAHRGADLSGLPQTVYRDGDSCGWWHTNALADRLRKAQLMLTVLPARYFS